jgi:hypothetical protein
MPTSILEAFVLDGAQEVMAKTVGACELPAWPNVSEITVIKQPAEQTAFKRDICILKNSCVVTPDA